MPKKILVVDDSALMRRVLCDIIDADIRFQVVDRAKDGLEAFDLLSRNSYDAVVLDVNMPRMNGLQLLQELRKYKIPARVMMARTDTMHWNWELLISYISRTVQSTAGERISAESFYGH